MEKKEFSKLENICQLRFTEASTCFHVCSQENHPVLFHNDDEFKAAMNIVAFTAFIFDDLKIYTFEIMDNHFHFAMEGPEDRIRLFTKNLMSKFAMHPSLAMYSSNFKNLTFNIFSITSLESLRNTIAYINRNGAVVNPNENVFTYRWGANRYFFNNEAKFRYTECGQETTCRERRSLFCSAKLDDLNKVILLDNYVSPMCFCEINAAEMYFRNSRHYFYSVSRNIEASMEIAKNIGENIFYSDEDLFAHIMSKSSKEYGCQHIADLSKEAKIALAKDLHYNYNAGNKQISRLLKIDLPTISLLFPNKW